MDNGNKGKYQISYPWVEKVIAQYQVQNKRHRQ